MIILSSFQIFKTLSPLLTQDIYVGISKIVSMIVGDVALDNCGILYGNVSECDFVLGYKNTWIFRNV